MGDFLSRVLYLGQHNRLASGLECRFTAGADDRSFYDRRRVSWRRVHAGGEFWFLRLLQTVPGARAAAQVSGPVRFRNSGWIPVLPAGGFDLKPEQEVPEAIEYAVQRLGPAQHLRRLLEGPGPVPAYEEHQVRGYDRWRMV